MMTTLPIQQHTTPSDFDVSQFTSAPLRVKKTIEVNCDMQQAFALVSDHEKLHLWVPMIKHQVQVNHQNAQIQGENGVGSERICNFGGDTLTEHIRYWQPNQAYGYSVVENKHAPAINHFGLFELSELANGHTLIAWSQYFDPKPWSLKSKMMPLMMRFVMHKALKNAKLTLQR